MYNTIGEKQKSALFYYHFAPDFPQVLQFLEDYRKKGYCFRGQENALWNISSSAQRKWNELRCRAGAESGVEYQQYLSMSLGYAKHNITFPNCNLKQRKIGLRDHERWGYLQHYSWPTPFIDFTDNMDVALFMAVRNGNSLCGNGHYSVYAINPEFEVENENYDLDEWVRDVGDGDEEFYSFQKWGHIHSWIMHKNRASWCPEISCGRMASQGGLFVYLSSANKSLEEEFAQWNKCKTGLSNGVDGVLHNQIVCIDIPCSTGPQVKDYLTKKSIDEESLGLADQSRDKIIKTQYEEFEKHFLSQELQCMNVNV